MKYIFIIFVFISLSSVAFCQTTDIKKWEELTKKPISEWKNLDSLNLRNNKLTSLPPEVSECKKLLWLQLQNNNFSQVEKDKIKAWLPNTKIEW